MRVLWLSNETPDIDGQGGQRRQYFQIRTLREAGHDIMVATLDGPQSDASLKGLASTHRARTRIGPFINPAFSATARRKIGDGWDRVVVAHSESWPRWSAVAQSYNAPILVDMHNVLSAWHRNRGRHGDADRWRAIEMSIGSRATVSVCSTAEAARVRPIVPRTVILPHGVDPSEWKAPPQRSSHATIKLFGNWSWEPNRDGLLWFAREVWGHLPPGVRCEIAGKGTDDLELPVDIRRVGRVGSISHFLRDAHVVAVPVRGGVGAPVKYLEALSSGVPVVATRDAAAFFTPFPVAVSDNATEWIEFVEKALVAGEEDVQNAMHLRSWALSAMRWEQVCAPLLAWVDTAEAS